MTTTTKTYHLIRRTSCAACDGKGIKTRSEWESYWNTHPGVNHDNLDPDAAEAWMKRVHLIAPWDTLPDEIGQCPECDGEGAVEDDAPLDEALQALAPKLKEWMGA